MGQGVRELRGTLCGRGGSSFKLCRRRFFVWHVLFLRHTGRMIERVFQEGVDHEWHRVCYSWRPGQQRDH